MLPSLDELFRTSPLCADCPYRSLTRVKDIFETFDSPSCTARDRSECPAAADAAEATLESFVHTRELRDFPYPIDSSPEELTALLRDDYGLSDSEIVEVLESLEFLTKFTQHR